jgi:hypothetical protein
MPLSALANASLTLVKKDGTVAKSGIPGTVSSNEIIVSAHGLSVEVGDSFIRTRPDGVVENFIVRDPGYQGGIAGAISPFYQSKGAS